MSKRFNPFRIAKQQLALRVEEVGTNNKMFSVQGALEWTWFHSPNRPLTRKALAHYKAMVHPHYSERLWLVKEVLHGVSPKEQDLQDYRHRWMEHMAQQWDNGEIS